MVQGETQEAGKGCGSPRFLLGNLSLLSVWVGVLAAGTPAYWSSEYMSSLGVCFCIS